MSITTTGPSGRYYHHAAKGSTEDVIHFTVPYTVKRISGDYVHQVEVEISMEDIFSLAADLIRSQKIRFYEEASDVDVLGLKKGM